MNLPAIAVQTGDTVNYNFTGTMMLATLCSVNGDQPVTATFGNVGISKIDSGKYLQDLKYLLNCGGAANTNKVTLMIKATPEGWDTKAIVSSVDGLGAQILNDGTPLR